MKKDIVVHCIRCGEIIFKIDNPNDFKKVKIRCGNCNLDQTVICEKAYKIRVVQRRDKLSTVAPIAAKTKVVV